MEIYNFTLQYKFGYLPPDNNLPYHTGSKEKGSSEVQGIWMLFSFSNIFNYSSNLWKKWCSMLFMTTIMICTNRTKLKSWRPTSELLMKRWSNVPITPRQMVRSWIYRKKNSINEVIMCLTNNKQKILIKNRVRE